MSGAVVIVWVSMQPPAFPCICICHLYGCECSLLVTEQRQWPWLYRRYPPMIPSCCRPAAHMQSRLRDKEFLLVQVLETLQALVVDAVSTQPAAAACAPSSTTPARTCAQHHDNHSNASNSPAACSCEAVQDYPAGPAQTSPACQHAVRPAHSAPAAPAHPAAAHSAPSASQQDDSSSLLWMLVLEAVQQREAEISRMYGLLASVWGHTPAAPACSSRCRRCSRQFAAKTTCQRCGGMLQEGLSGLHCGEGRAAARQWSA